MRITIDYTEDELRSMGIKVDRIPRGQNIMILDTNVRGSLVFEVEKGSDSRVFSMNVKCERVTFGRREDGDGTCPAVLKQKRGGKRKPKREVLL